MIDKVIEFFLRLWAQERECPGCAADPVKAIFASRRTYVGKCPKCGVLWT